MEDRVKQAMVTIETPPQKKKKMPVENIVEKGDKRAQMALDCSPNFLRLL